MYFCIPHVYAIFHLLAGAAEAFVMWGLIGPFRGGTKPKGANTSQYHMKKKIRQVTEG